MFLFERQLENKNLHWVYLSLLMFNILFVIGIVFNIITRVCCDSYYKNKTDSTSKFFSALVNFRIWEGYMYRDNGLDDLGLRLSIGLVTYTPLSISKLIDFLFKKSI